MSRFDLLNECEEILYADANCFEPYPNENLRLRLHTGEKYESLKRSIIANGIIEPIIATPSTNRGKLIAIAGTNRFTIAKELGIEVPYRLKTNLTEEQADLICIDTNLENRQYDELLPSELAFLLKSKHDIMKNQGRRSDLETLVQIEPKLNTSAIVGKEYKLSESNVKRYIRLTYLNKDLLQMVDDNKMGFNAGVTISMLKNNEQIQLVDVINNGLKISLKIAEELKNKSLENDKDINIKSIIDKHLANTNNAQKINISKGTKEKIKELIPTKDIERIEIIIVEAITMYYQNRETAN